MAKALEGSDSKKEEPLFPEAMEIPAPLETPVEAMKGTGGERKPSGEETPSKKQKVLLTGHHQRHQDREKRLRRKVQ